MEPKITSLNFKNGTQQSINIQSNQDGQELLNAVDDYIQDLKDEIQDQSINKNTPLAQKDPNTVILDFIIWHLGDTDGNDGTNYTLQEKTSHNHYTYNLTKQQWEQKQPKWN